jgi:hypothetical protein
MSRRVCVKTLVCGPIQLEHVEQEGDELAVATYRRKPLDQLVDEPTERRRIHSTLLRPARYIVQESMDREALCLGRAVALEERRYGLLEREQTKRQVDQSIQFLDLRFQRGNAILLVIGHALSTASPGARRP